MTPTSGLACVVDLLASSSYLRDLRVTNRGNPIPVAISSPLITSITLIRLNLFKIDFEGDLRTMLSLNYFPRVEDVKIWGPRHRHPFDPEQHREWNRGNIFPQVKRLDIQSYEADICMKMLSCVSGETRLETLILQTL